MKTTKSLFLFALLIAVSSCNRQSSATCALKNLPLYGKYFNGHSGSQMATYLKSSGKNAVYVLVKNYEFEQFKAISSKYSRSGESIFYGEGLDRDFSFVPDKMYIPKGKNISVFEFDGKHTLERSGATCYFVGRAQYEQGKDGGNGDMIIHFW